MKRGAPRPDAIGAASAVPTTNSVSGSVVSTNNSIPIGNPAQTSAQLTRTHESSPQPSVVPYGNIHSTPGQNIVHINSASLNCIRSLTPQPSASGQSLRTVNTSVGINLSGIGTPVSGQITIPASAVSAAAAAHHLHSGATNLILRQTNQNLVNPQNTQTLQQTTNNSVTAGQTSVHRFNQTGNVVPTQVNYQSSATVSAIPTSLNLSLSKGSANVSNISQITVGGSQGGCSQTPHVQLPLNTINAVVSGQTSVANQTVPIGQIHQVGSSVTSVVTPSNVQVSGTQSQGTVTTHQIVYSPRTTHRLLPATQLSSAQTTFNAGLSSVTKQTTSTPISSSDSTPAMQSALAQYQSTTVTGYSVAGNTAGSSRTTAGSTSSQQYQSSSSSKTSQQVIQTVGGIQVRHKSHSATANSPPNTPALLQVTSTAPSQNISNAPNLPSGHNQSHHGTMGNTASIVVHTPKQSTISHNVHSSSGLGMTSHGSSHNTHHTNSATVNLGTHHGTNPPSRLKVEDALSYLDKVKFKFGDQPQVYNDFLDIMKEFKSQSIDTPGVIDRVSSLFKEHPELIEGFNTFLPPGYKIEVKAIDQGYAYQVSVSMPSPTQSTTTVVHTQGLRQGISSPPMSTNQTSGSIVQSQNTKSAPVMQILQGSGIIHTTLVSNVPCGTPSQSQSSVPNTALQVPSSVSVTHSGSSHTSNATNLHLTTYTSSNISVSGNNQHSNNNLHNNSTISQAQAHQAVSQALSQVETGHPTPQNQPVEFNHAINYVNKIKNRFQGQPEKYKRFLEILHTYQKEQRSMKEPNSTTGGIGNTSTLGHISSNVSLAGTVGGKHLTEAEVYSQVAKLFENQDDLLAEFGQFLPDATSHQSNLSSGKPLTNDSHVKKPIMKPAYNNSNRDRERDRERENREREHRDREHRETLEREREFREREREHRDRERNNVSTQKYGHTSGQIKRSPPYLPQNISHRDGPPMKKHKIASCRDVTIAEAGKYGALSDYAFFDKVRKALRTQEVYENFLRCLILFNEEIISKSELVQLTGPFLGKFPELFKWFKDFIGHNDTGIEPIPNNVARQERPQGDNALEVDLTTCKRLGASYCALPKANSDSSYGSPISNSIFPSGTQTHANSLQGSRKCSGRTALCREVLNDTWVSFPTWSEDSTFVTNRKTQFEEYIYRCEDERFELDVVIETNASTIRVLEGVCRRLQRLSQDELQRFRLDDTLGGTSAVLHQRALRRIYGDKAPDIVDGLKRNPAVAVPVVLRRLKAKEDEWREAQKSFNKIWREQNEKYYLKSLDHQGINFKQNDVKSLRSKSLFNEIETLYDERHEQNEEGATSAATGSAPSNGPHLILSYAAHMTPNSSIPANPVTAGAALGPLGNGTPPGPIVRGVLDDAASLLIHHVRRQTGVQKQEKARIKSLLRQFIPDLFHHPRQQLSDDERDDDDDKEEDIDSNLRSSPTISDSKSGIKSITNTTNIKKSPSHDSSTSTSGETDSKLNVGNESLTVEDIDLSLVKMEEDEKIPPHAITDDPDEYYTLFMANNNWYLFLRLHAILCSRLATIHAHAQRLIEQERTERVRRKQSTAVALRLKPQPDVEVEQYYPAFLDMVKNVLDGNMDATAYEDTLREMFGIHAYIAFTLDKVVSYAVRQLQHCATERGAIECCNMFLHERRKAYPGYNGTNNSNRKESIRDKDFFKNLSKDVYSLVKNSSGNWKSGGDLNSFTSGAGGPCSTAHRRKAAEATYQRSSEMLLRDENCFKIYIYKNNLRVTIELLDTETDDADPQSSMAEAQKWSNYVERFANHTPTSTSTDKIKENSRRSGNSAINQDSKNCDSVKNCDSSNVQNSDSAIIEKGSRKRFDRDRAVEVKEEKNLSDQDDNETGMETILGGWSNRKATFLKRNVRDFHQRAERTAISSVSTSKKNENAGLVNELHKTSSADRISPEIDKSEHMNELERKLIEKGLPQRVNTLNVANDFVVDDKTQCRFDLNSYKMVFIVNKESFLYKKDAFTKAKKCHPIVTKQLNSRFRVWHKRWLNIHVTEAQQKATYDWLMGRTDGLCPNRTRTLSNNDIRRTPYAPYNRYKVERLQPSSVDPDSG